MVKNNFYRVLVQPYIIILNFLLSLKYCHIMQVEWVANAVSCSLFEINLTVSSEQYYVCII